MKKLLCGVTIALALMMLLGVAALAAEPTTNGIYGVSWEDGSGYTVDPGWKVQKAADPATAAGIAKSTVTIDKQEVTDFYAEGAKVTFTLTGLPTSTTYKLILGLNKETTSPQEPDIEYIDQGNVQNSGTTGTVTFTVYPKASSGPIYLYVDDMSNKIKKIGSFNLYQNYVLGDVDNNGLINANDALMALQIGGKLITPTERETLAADVDKNGTVNANDALMILQYAGKIITEW